MPDKKFGKALKTIYPKAPGTKKLSAEHGSKLVAVRYRYNKKTRMRYKTIEIVVDQGPWKKRRKK